MKNSEPGDRRLRLTKVALLVILAGTAVIGKHHGAWPIATWPMYSAKVFALPKDTYSIVEGTKLGKKK